jgi:hypothetical protein
MSKLDVSRMQKWLAAGIQPGLTGPGALDIIHFRGLEVRPDLRSSEGQIRQDGKLLVVIEKDGAQLTPAGKLTRRIQILKERNANARAIRLMKGGHNI